MNSIVHQKDIMPKTSKDNDYSISHCLQRLNERYSLEVDQKQYNQWNKTIQDWIKKYGDTIKITNSKVGFLTDLFLNSNIKPISKTKINDNNLSYTLQFMTKINDKSIILYLVFETERNCITTFLPPESIKK